MITYTVEPVNTVINKQNKLAAILAGDRIKEEFWQEHLWPFSQAAEKGGRNKEVTILPRWP